MVTFLSDDHSIILFVPWVPSILLLRSVYLDFELWVTFFLSTFWVRLFCWCHWSSTHVTYMKLQFGNVCWLLVDLLSLALVFIYNILDSSHSCGHFRCETRYHVVWLLSDHLVYLLEPIKILLFLVKQLLWPLNFMLQFLLF